jgi:hypothetical protein
MTFTRDAKQLVDRPRILASNFLDGLVQMDEQTGLNTRVVVLEERVARLAASIQVLLESIRAGNAYEVSQSSRT